MVLGIGLDDLCGQLSGLLQPHMQYAGNSQVSGAGSHRVPCNPTPNGGKSSLP